MGRSVVVPVQEKSERKVVFLSDVRFFGKMMGARAGMLTSYTSLFLSWPRLIDRLSKIAG
jgi:hypothetical protein